MYIYVWPSLSRILEYVEYLYINQMRAVLDLNLLVHCDLPRQYSFGTNLRLTGPVPADSRR